MSGGVHVSGKWRGARTNVSRKGKTAQPRYFLTTMVLRVGTRDVCVVDTCVLSSAGRKQEDGALCCYPHQADFCTLQVSLSRLPSHIRVRHPTLVHQVYVSASGMTCNIDSSSRTPAPRVPPPRVLGLGRKCTPLSLTLHLLFPDESLHLTSQNTVRTTRRRAMHLDERRLVFNSPSGSMLPTRTQHPTSPNTMSNDCTCPLKKHTHNAILPTLT